MDNLLIFLNKLEKNKIHYNLNKIRDSILVEVCVPGERWEIEFFENNNIEIEKFKSDGKIFGKEELKNLFEKFSD